MKGLTDEYVHSDGDSNSKVSISLKKEREEGGGERESRP